MRRKYLLKAISLSAKFKDPLCIKLPCQKRDKFVSLYLMKRHDFQFIIDPKPELLHTLFLTKHFLKLSKQHPPQILMEATKQAAPIKFVHSCVGIIQGKFMAEGYTFLSACMLVPYL